MFSDAAFNWIRHDEAVYFTEKETAKIIWTVDIGSGFPLSGVKIQRGTTYPLKLVILKSESSVEKQLPGRESDLDLIVEGVLNVINVTFILRNLVQSDEMGYQITVGTTKFDSNEDKTTSLQVLGKSEFLKSCILQSIFYYSLLNYS